MLKSISLILLAFFISALPASQVNAQSETVKSAREEVQASADKLTAVQEENLTAEEKAEKETALKKEALGKIIALTVLEAEELKNKIESLTDIEAEFLILRDDFLNKLAVFPEYLDDFTAAHEASFDLVPLEKLAGDFQAWRAASYDPEVKKMVDFIIVFQSKNLLRVADQRFTKISVELKKIKLPFGKTRSDIWLNLNQAALNLSEARIANAQAMVLLLEYLPKTEPADKTEVKTETKEEISDKISLLTSDDPSPANEPVEDKPTVRDAVQKSILGLRFAYENFIALAELFKKLPR